MDRKYKLQINKPIDKYFNKENIFQTPKTKEHDSSTIKNSSITEMETASIEEEKSYQFTTFFYKFVIVSLIFVLLFTNFYLKKSVPVINEVIREVKNVPEDYEKIKEELSLLKNKTENLCLLEKQCKVLYDCTSLPYKFGFFSLQSTDPHCVLLDNSKCFSFYGSTGKITFTFPKPVKITKIGIFHPKTKNTSSAIKNFTVNNVPFTFLNDTLSFYECDLMSDKFIFDILSNYGRKEYTVIYRIFLIGYEM